MLHLMRKHAGSWMIKVVLGVIVVVFVFWGVGSYRSDRENRIAVVNGQVIALEEYRSTYEQLLDQYRRQFGGALDQQLVKTLGLKRQALDHLINRRLVLQKADELNLQVTDNELADAIQGMEVFQENGRFVSERYQRLLAMNRMTPEVFEESLRRDLLVDKTQQYILGSVKVSDAEAWESFQWREEQIAIDYVLFKPSTFNNDVEVAPEELESYFSSHEKDYETSASVKAGYVRLDFEAFESQVSVSEDEIVEYFEDNRETFGTPKRVRARHILFQLTPEAPQETLDAVRAKAQKVLEEARSGADFAELARQYSEDPGSKDQGGDLGFFTRERMVKSFSDAAFSMAPGQISDLVASRFGWHIIKVEQIEEATEPVLAEVYDEIQKKLVKEAAKNLAYDEAESLYMATYGGGRLGEIAEAKGRQVLETDFFARSDPIEGVSPADKFAEIAFGLGDDEVSEPLELSDGYYLVEIVERKDAEIPTLQSIAEKVRTDLLAVKQDALAQEKAGAFLESLQQGKDLDAAAKDQQLEVKSSDFFKRTGSIPEIGSEQELVTVAFSMGPTNPIPDNVIKGRQGYFVIRFKDRKSADRNEFESRKEDIIAQIISQKQQRFINQWLARLRQEGEVIVQEGFVD
jgi:peptidyl-prolyl cis-trans isomerase D